MGVLDGKAVVITGAGGGLGAAYARHVAGLGAAVLVNDIDPAAAGRVAEYIAAGGGRAAAHAGDVSDWAFGAALIGACLDRFGRLDGLVNNAGILRHGTAEEMREADLRAMIGVNLIGTAACGAAAIRAMRAAGQGGSIVNVASGSQAGDVAIGGYGATKAAVASLTYTWAMELRGTPIRVNAISPLADTAMAKSNAGFMAAQSAGREVVYGTLPAPEVNAPLVGYLLSDAAAGIHGQVVRIAGEELSFVTHPMIADPVLRGAWTTETLPAAFRDTLAARQQRLGLTYEPAR
jgi:NAD(P)-dependent dehydrogenase (short-subunit alcohol dehydrogenase family)